MRRIGQVTLVLMLFLVMLFTAPDAKAQSAVAYPAPDGGWDIEYPTTLNGGGWQTCHQPPEGGECVVAGTKRAVGVVEYQTYSESPSRKVVYKQQQTDDTQYAEQDDEQQRRQPPVYQRQTGTRTEYEIEVGRRGFSRNPLRDVSVRVTLSRGRETVLVETSDPDYRPEVHVNRYNRPYRY